MPGREFVRGPVGVPPAPTNADSEIQEVRIMGLFNTIIVVILLCGIVGYLVSFAFEGKKPKEGDDDK